LNNILTNILNRILCKYLSIMANSKEKDSNTMRLMNSPFIGSFNTNQPHMIDLRMFMNQYLIAPDDTYVVPNFVCMNPEYPSKYCVPKDMISDLMHLLNICYTENIPNQILECQYINDSKVSSLFFDFVFDTKNPSIDFSTVVLGFSRIVFGILVKFLNIESEKSQHYLMYFGTQNPVYPTACNKYRSKFRIIIPSVMIESDLKLFVYQRVFHSKDIKRIFQEKLNYDVRECFQMKVRNAPVTMAGSFISGEENDPMVLHNVYDICVSRENGFSYENSQVNNITERFDNIVHEVSVNYNSGEKSVIRKRHYCLNNLGVAKTYDEIHAKPRLFFTMAYDDSVRTFKMLSITHPTALTIYEELNILNDERFNSFDQWMIIIKSLASSEVDYHCIAVMITYERVGKIIVENNVERVLSWDEFTTNWNDARSEFNSNLYSSKYSWRSLRYWANIDNKTRMLRFINNRLTHMITYDIAHSVYQARLEPLHFARYIKFMFGHMFITENTSTDKYIWYEFVVPTSKDRDAGQLFKWRELGTEPDSLIYSMSNDLQPVMNTIHSQMQGWLKLAQMALPVDDARIEYIKHLSNVYNREIMVLFKTINKRNIIKEACTLFKNNSFLKKLDMIPDIIGVGNGVVEFDVTKKRLLNYYHTYPITKYTDTNYIPYDEENPYIKTMYRFLRSLFPEDEMDAMDFLLYFFSTSLDGYEKEALFIIIHGGGSNGKSVLMDIFKETLGSAYARKLQLSFITDQSRNKASAPDSSLMDLKYARMVYYSEAERNEKVNVAKVKELTGGETMSGRGMYQTKQQNFKCNCNHIVTTNYRFIIESTDHATWRRFICYRFKFSFEEEEDPEDSFIKLKDPELINTIKKDKRYHEAFLAILMHYHTMLYSKYNGRILKVPKQTIDHETQEYRIREDIFERFISTRVVYKENFTQNMDEFVENFRANHSKQNNEKFVMQKEDMIHNFRNSSIGKFIKENVSGFYIENLYSLAEHEYSNDSVVLFNKWRESHN